MTIDVLYEYLRTMNFYECGKKERLRILRENEISRPNSDEELTDMYKCMTGLADYVLMKARHRYPTELSCVFTPGLRPEITAWVNEGLSGPYFMRTLSREQFKIALRVVSLSFERYCDIPFGRAILEAYEGRTCGRSTQTDASIVQISDTIVRPRSTTCGTQVCQECITHVCSSHERPGLGEAWIALAREKKHAENELYMERFLFEEERGRNLVLQDEYIRMAWLIEIDEQERHAIRSREITAIDFAILKKEREDFEAEKIRHRTLTDDRALHTEKQDAHRDETSSDDHSGGEQAQRPHLSADAQEWKPRTTDRFLPPAMPALATPSQPHRGETTAAKRNPHFDPSRPRSVVVPPYLSHTQLTPPYPHPSHTRLTPPYPYLPYTQPASLFQARYGWSYVPH